MELRRMGRTGLEVPALCLGTMTFGLQVDEPGSVAILDKAYESGLVFLDTSDAYPLGRTFCFSMARASRTRGGSGSRRTSGCCSTSPRSAAPSRV